MARNLLGKFQTQEFSSWKGLTKDNHLGAIFRAAPQKASNLMVQILAQKRGRTLDTLLSQFPTREFETSDEYVWDVVGSTNQNIPLPCPPIGPPPIIWLYNSVTWEPLT